MSKVDKYKQIMMQLDALISDEADITANLANTSALLNQYLPEINWVGFYLWKETELVLGPFQGLPACIRIQANKGVCGTAYAKQETIRVDNVDLFPGHIVCDAKSKSEIVIPLKTNGSVYGVLDIDSPILNRFDATDQTYLEEIVARLMQQIEVYI